MTARVLVVDDIPANVRLLEARLSAEYFDVITALAGVELVLIEMGHKIEPGVGVAAAQNVFAKALG